MQRSRVSADAKSDAARERDQLRQRSGECDGAAGGNGGGERLFARTGVDQRRESALCEPLGDGGITLGRPALGAPASSGSDESDRPRGAWKSIGEPRGAPGFGVGIDRKLRVDGGKRVAGDG